MADTYSTSRAITLHTTIEHQGYKEDDLAPVALISDFVEAKACQGTGPVSMAGEPDSLQKDLIIFLLAALLIIALTLFISWIVWRKWCGKELKQAREGREGGVTEDWLAASRPSMTRRDDDAESDRSSRTGLFEHDFFQAPSAAPSAPTMRSFTGPSTSSAMSMDTISSGVDSMSRDPNSTFGGARLPSYETVMREHQ